MTDNELSQTPPIVAAVMGTGNWGRNFVRVLRDLSGVELRFLVDPNLEARRAASQIAPDALGVSDIEETGFAFDFAVIATPAALHTAHALVLLGKEKHVLLEKPAAVSETDASLLCEAEKRSGKKLMVGHQLLFHPLFCRLVECIEQGMIGRLSHVLCERTGPVDFSKEPGVIWSYGPHDVSMLTALMNGFPIQISATAKVLSDGVTPEEADMRIAFSNDVTARIVTAHRPSEKTRRLTVEGDKGALVFDDASAGGALVFRAPLGSIQTVSTPPFEEPLMRECAHALRCIRTGEEPLTGPSHILTVTRILARCARESLPRKEKAE